MASYKELKALIVLAGRIDPSLQNALSRASNHSLKMAHNMEKSAKHMHGLGDTIKGMATGMIVANVLMGISNGITGVISNSVKLASNLVEVQNVVDTTFTSSSIKINEWAKSAKKSFGLSELQAKQFTGTLGAMLKSSGLANKYLTPMSENLVGLAGDFASFYNIAQDEAFYKIRAGIAGEVEPLRQLGINMTVANLEAYALSKGIKTSYEMMDQASQTALRYSYLMSVSKDAQGDFVKTQGEFANQTRTLKTNFDELSATVASKILPKINKYVILANKFIERIDADKISNVVVTAVDTIIDKVGLLIELSSYLYRFIKDNWGIIEPILWGIVGAMVAWNVALKAALIIEALTKAWQVASAVMMMFQSGARIATVAQWALNAAMTANPIGIVIVAIGALIAVVVALYKNWDTVSAALSNAWLWFKNLISGMPDVALALAGPLAPLLLLIKHFEKVKEVVGGAIDVVKRFFSYSGNNSGDADVSRQILANSGMYAYAGGGFANTPSIFGEAGLEAAIPIKYRNPRSISLLNQTAKAIGVGHSNREKPPIIINIHTNGSSDEGQATSIANAVKQAVKEALEEIQRDEERVTYGFS